MASGFAVQKRLPTALPREADAVLSIRPEEVHVLPVQQ